MKPHAAFSFIAKSFFFDLARYKNWKFNMLALSDKNYLTILKWRQGEYQALFHLEDAIKDRVTPLLEIPEEQWDFEAEAPSKNLDDHLKTFGRRLNAKWKNRYCFIDSCHISNDKKMADGTHHLERIFDLARDEDGLAIPTIGLSRSSEYCQAVKRIVALDKRGVCMRLEPKDFASDLPKKLLKFSQLLSVKNDEVHLLIDTSDMMNEDASTLAEWWMHLLGLIPNASSWASLTIAGSSFPQNLSTAMFKPDGQAPRNEWLAYKIINEKVRNKKGRIPTFGDYACAPPRTAKIDPRLIDPNAKIKYTTDNSWLVTQGKQIKKNGRSQYQGLCASIINHRSNVYKGQNYSHGDKFVFDCANGGGTGGSSTWPSVASNHHITMVVRNLASFYGSSNMP